MPWVRLEDDMPENPKVRRITDTAFRLHIYAVCYCARHLTDGHISKLAARDLLASFPVDESGPDAGQSGPRAISERPGNVTRCLLKVGLWEPEPDGYLIHDYLDYNPSKADVERDRAAARERMRARRGGDVQANGSGEPPPRSGERSGTPTRPVSKSSSTSKEPPRASAPQPGSHAANEAERNTSLPWKCPLCRTVRERTEQLLREHLFNVHRLEDADADAELAKAAP